MSPPPPPDPAGSADSPDWTGRIIGGRYRVEAVLGVGGMGTAYRAYDQKLERAVVLKVPHARHFSAGESRGRFQDEIRKLIAIEHPHVVKVHDVDDEAGTPYAVFPYLAGGNLAARMRAAGSPLGPEEVVPWLVQIADALDDLHEHGDIHRDVKPDNILFDKPLGKGKANAYLADFGLAKALGLDPARLFQSRTGTLIGTQAYMAPEQFTQQGPMTGAGDQYALATTVYQALSGEMPFTVSSAEELAVAKAMLTPRPLWAVAKNVAPGIDRAVMRALSANPKARFPSCADFAVAFAAAAGARSPSGAVDPSVGMASDPSVPPAAPPPVVPPPARTGNAPSQVGSRTQPPARPRAAGMRGRLHGRSLQLAATILVLGSLVTVGLLSGWFKSSDPSRGTEGARTASVGVPTPVPFREPALPPPAAPTPPDPTGETPAPAPQEKPSPSVTALAEAKALAERGDWEGVRAKLSEVNRLSGASPELPKELLEGLKNWDAPPEVTIEQPLEASTVDAPSVRVRGTFRSFRTFDILKLDGTPVPAPSGRFAVDVPLKAEGPHEITVTVEYQGAQRLVPPLVRSFAYVRAWQAPATLTITAPSNGTAVMTPTVGVAWSVVSPRAKDAVTVTRNGQAVPVLDGGRAVVGLVEGENRIEVVLRDEKGGERAKQSVLVTREKDPFVAPTWAKVSADQIAEAKRLGIPVAFENTIGMRFVLVPAGTFTMGSPEGEAGHHPNETQHQVTLSVPFFVSIHETTNGQYRRFKQDHDSGKYKEESLNGDTQPVANVSHTDAVEFATWLSGQESGRTYRLPTESEWEYAARANTTTRYYWGDDEGGFARNANILDAKASAKFDISWTSSWDDGFAATAPVGTFLPNGWGLYDMIGNVWEGCADWIANYPTGTVTDPMGPSSGTDRVLRGGSWDHSFGCACAAHRHARGPDVRGATSPDARDGGFGFRLVVPTRALSGWATSGATAPPPASPPSALPAPPVGPPAMGDGPAAGMGAPEPPTPSPTHPGIEVPLPAPAWAKVSPDQVAEAKQLGIPVAFENSIGMRFVLVPAGIFTMGSPERESGRSSDETQHRVRLTQPFYVSIHETTNGQYRRFKQDHDSGKYGEASLNGDTQPVVMVSHTEAAEFATWLSGQETTRTYRLPTESEWEYACRAGTAMRFSFGYRDEDLPRFGNFWDKNDPSGSNRKDLDDGASVTAPVGRYAPNVWGLHDMHGNVWEWCSDWYGRDYPTGSVTDPAGPASGDRRVLRGGSWHLYPVSARAAERFDYDPGDRGDFCGFRLVVPARASR